jgi:hypothetical protein
VIGSPLGTVPLSDVAPVGEGPQPRCDVALLMKTLLRSGSSFDTSPPAGFCREAGRCGPSTGDRSATSRTHGIPQAAGKQPAASKEKRLIP